MSYAPGQYSNREPQLEAVAKCRSEQADEAESKGQQEGLPLRAALPLSIREPRCDCLMTFAARRSPLA